METKTNEQPMVELKAVPNGPLLVKGQVKIINDAGEEMVMDKTAICRCGLTQHQPFCDGSHLKV